MDQTLATVVAAVIVSLATVLASQAVARRFQKLGGGEAQDRLNDIRKEMVDELDQRVRFITSEWDGCKADLAKVQRAMAKQRAVHAAAARHWVTERRDLRREITELHIEIRALQPNRTGHKDRATDA